MTDFVSAALQRISALPDFSLTQWDTLIRQARVADLLPRLAVLIDEASLSDAVPEAPRRHLVASRITEDRQHLELLQEVGHIHRAMSPIGVEPILLKGAAYHLANLPAARGRNFSDIDILIPKEKLPQVESQLMLHGWATTCDNAYDQRYYRQWMHELPPFRHIRRATALDVHHGILPDTARSKPDSRKLLAAAIPMPDHPGVKVLSQTDMVLHSMTHLFHNEEFSHGLRDISDIDLLLRHFGADPAYWRRLVERAHELDLVRPLAYGLLYSNLLLGTPIPEEVLSKCETPHLWLDAAWRRALRSRHWTASDRFTPLALFLLYVRAHWLRMPPSLLVHHLTVKAFRRAKKDD